LLLQDPACALAEGYCGERFELGAATLELVLSIRARSLQEFAGKLISHSRLQQPGDPSIPNTERQVVYVGNATPTAGRNQGEQGGQ
jgi:hypothetical protein